MSSAVPQLAPAAAYDFEVARHKLNDCRFLPAADPLGVPLQADEVQLRIDKFAFTANNISYAVFGEAMSYWQFFPAAEGWGRIPVWGFAEVIASRHPQVREGERLFGYLPMSTHLRLLAGKVSERSIQDIAPARAKLSPVYSSLSRVLRDPGYFPARENEQALLRPLFMTAFLIDDFLNEQAAFGAEQILLSSASSKTALGLAFLLRRRRRGEVIGLTSAANVEFCRRSGYYDRVLAYEQLPSVAASRPTVFVDMAGDGRLLRSIHSQFGGQLRYSCMVGGTHWKQRETQHDLPGARPEFFFAPTQLRKRQQDWGAAGLEEHYALAWRPFLLSVSTWMRVQPQRGLASVEKVYREVLEGRAPPELGYILSLA